MVSPKKKSKPKSKPVINYPPVPTKKWIPPDLRPKPKPPPGYQKPQGLTQKLEVSNLQKVWHNFRWKAEYAILGGTISMRNKMFPPITNGRQGACIAATACIFAAKFNPSKWDYSYVDQIVRYGDALYSKSLTHKADRCLARVGVKDIYPSTYVGDDKITFKTDDPIKGVLQPNLDPVPKFIKVLTEFFSGSGSGILQLQRDRDRTYFGIWKSSQGLFMFDPEDRDIEGNVFKGKQGNGIAVVIKFQNVNLLTRKLAGLFNLNSSACCYEVWPFRIERIVAIDRQPPSRLGFGDGDVFEDQDLQTIEERKEQLKRILKQKAKPPALQPTPSPPQVPPEVIEELNETNPNLLEDPKVAELITKKSEPKIAPRKPRKESVTFFNEFIPNTISILRASTHQSDPKFTSFQGKQGIPNAIAAIGMLRIEQCKYWIKNTLDDILLTGNAIYRDIIKQIGNQISLTLEHVPKKIVIKGRNFTPIIEKRAVGILNSRDPRTLSLSSALRVVLTNYDNCIVEGPIALAIWVERGKLYMFDPNERDCHGKKLVTELTRGSSVTPLNTSAGYACVTCFKKLGDLVALYMDNLNTEMRKAFFTVSRIDIEDYVELNLDWFNFKGIAPDKWILRGTFNQNDRRFPMESRGVQCTANAIVAVAYSKILELPEWNSDTVDLILEYGDTVYRNVRERIINSGGRPHMYLTPVEVDRRLSLGGEEVLLEIEDCYINGMIYASLEDSIPNLTKGLEDFFIDNETGVVTSCSISVGIWKKDNMFYYFDSHTRNENGLRSGIGTACVLRVTSPEELARCILCNLVPSKTGGEYSTVFNICNIGVSIYKKDETDDLKLTTDDYIKLTPWRGILRAHLSCNDKKYGLAVGKQSDENCIVSIWFNHVTPAAQWTVSHIDEILDIGNGVYLQNAEKTQVALEDAIREKAERDEEIEEFNEENRETDQEKNELIISGYRCKLEYSTLVEEGNVDQDLRPALLDYYNISETEEELEEEDATTEGEVKVTAPSDEAVDESSQAPELPKTATAESDDDNEEKPPPENQKIEKELEPPKPTVPTTPPEDSYVLFTCGDYRVTIWHDGTLFYLFDPQPRDEQGEVIGKEDWSVRRIQEEVDDEEETESEQKESEFAPIESDFIKGLSEEQQLGAGDGDREVAEQAGGEEGSDNERDGNEAGKSGEGTSAPMKHSKSYWDALKEQGKACTIWFTSLFNIIDFITSNIPLNKRGVDPFTLKSVKMTREPDLKDIYNPETGAPKGPYAGNWYSFNEIEYGRWIIRGTKNMCHPSYPSQNRNKQAIACCVIAAGMSQLDDALKTMSTLRLDDVMDYGDRLLTAQMRVYRRRLETKLKVHRSQLEQLVAERPASLSQCYLVCISTVKLELRVTHEPFDGHVALKEKEIGSAEPAEIQPWNLEQALLQFFKTHRVGLLSCNGDWVAIWRGVNTFYMYDPHPCGPSGLHSPTGVPCMTRFLKDQLPAMCQLYRQNLPLGDNNFILYSLDIKRDLCVRKRAPDVQEEKVEGVLKKGAFKLVNPGKKILSGTISQEHQLLGKGKDVQQAAIAFIALTMNLLQKPSYWAPPDVDEVIMQGSDLYDSSVNALGFDFNPWEDKLDIYRVKNDFNIGVHKVNCEVRQTTQTGLINKITSKYKNLRQGIESFFEENTHGILITPSITLSLWEEEESSGPVIYIFDPYPRSCTGMPYPSGSGCLVACLNSEIAANHIVSIMNDDQRGEKYLLVPVEIVVNKKKHGRKTRDKTVCEKERAEKEKAERDRKEKEERQKRETKLCADKVMKKEMKQVGRKTAEEERRRKEVQRRFKFGRATFEEIKPGEAILRGQMSQSSPDFPNESRGKQDICTCLMFYVKLKTQLPAIEKWCWHQIDDVIICGNQHYIDSYVLYKPKEPKLGLDNIVRTMCIQNREIKIELFMPHNCGLFFMPQMNQIVLSYFQTRSFGLLRYEDKWVGIYIKDGVFYLFYPEGVDHEGKKVKADKGSAAVFRYFDVVSLCEKLTELLIEENSKDLKEFFLAKVALKRIEQK